VLERFHDSQDAGVETVEQALAALEENWIDAGYASAQEMQEALGEGRQIVEAHIERKRHEPTTARTLFVEKTLRLDLGTFDLIGRVDRVDEADDDSLEIIDYKSGRPTVHPEDVANDIAMACYQLLVSRAHPGRAVRATIIALRSGARASHSLAPAELDELEADLRVLGSEIVARDFAQVRPVPKSLCEDCDFLALCLRQDGFAWTPAQNRES
jgi:RecB family exonuclease